MAAGEAFGITPYGTEAMHVLRAEKGYAIVGQDTDGTVTPYDLGMRWIVNEAKGDFIGRRSLRRPDTARSDRKRFVGLLPLDPGVRLPEGAQLVLEDSGSVPMRSVGHVTSSYRSAALDRTFALAMLERGDELVGATVASPLADGTVIATVTSPVFWDPEGDASRWRPGGPRGMTGPWERDPLTGHRDTLSSLAQTTGGAVGLETVPFLTQVDLRLDPDLVARAPYPLPLEPNTAWEDGPRAALWLGPDEWLILGPPGEAPAVAAELEIALHGLHRSVVDVSANRVALELVGRRRHELLTSGCSLDLHPRAWRIGMCAQTLVARVPVILHERADSTGILVRPSFAGHLVDVLADAAHGLPRDRRHRS